VSDQGQAGAASAVVPENGLPDVQFRNTQRLREYMFQRIVVRLNLDSTIVERLSMNLSLACLVDLAFAIEGYRYEIGHYSGTVASMKAMVGERNFYEMTWRPQQTMRETTVIQ